MRFKTRIYIWLISMAVILICWPFGPYLFSSSWRSLYGVTVDDARMSVPVLPGWFARHQGETVSVVRVTPRRIPFTYYFETTSFRVLDSRAGDSREEITNRWESDGASRGILEDYSVAQSRTVVVGGSPTLCRELRPSDPTGLRAVCVLRGEVAVYFWGRSESLPSFYNLLEACTMKGS